MARARIDALTKVTGTLPNAANTVNSNGIDLGATTPFPVTENVQVKISLTAATGANNKNINIRLQDAIDDVTSNYANIALFANPVLRSTDDDGGGHSATSVTVQLQPTSRRWIRAVALGEANGGDSSDGTFSCELLY